jgi:hypothetical protein
MEIWHEHTNIEMMNYNGKMFEVLPGTILVHIREVRGDTEPQLEIHLLGVTP